MNPLWPALRGSRASPPCALHHRALRACCRSDLRLGDWNIVLTDTTPRAPRRRAGSRLRQLAFDLSLVIPPTGRSRPVACVTAAGPGGRPPAPPAITPCGGSRPRPPSRSRPGCLRGVPLVCLVEAGAARRHPQMGTRAGCCDRSAPCRRSRTPHRRLASGRPRPSRPRHPSSSTPSPRRTRAAACTLSIQGCCRTLR